MYYIVNQTNHIIAADKTLMDVLDVADLSELHKNIALNSIEFTALTDNILDITTAKGSNSYTIVKNTMASLLGDLTLVKVIADEQVQKEVEIEEVDDELELSVIEPISFDDDDGIDKLIDEINEENEEDKPFEIISNDEPITFGDNEEPLAELESEEVKSEEIEETISVLDNEPEKDTLFLTEDINASLENEVEDKSAIVIDILDVSQKIGISSDDYNTFLNEYIDTALTLEDDLKSKDSHKISHAIVTLSHLSNVLHLPVLNDIIDQIKHSDNEVQNKNIESFYKTLGRLTTNTSEVQEAEMTLDMEKEVVLTEDMPVEDTLVDIEPSISELAMERSGNGSLSDDSFGTIDLSSVKPIHFDFQLEEAANDLSLPVELIEEFVIDFIEQAHTETDKMLEAYERGDLDTIQKIGHLLKGTSSNLRINPLADTLYKIQFCEDSSKLEDLIKEYWAHFLSFETKIKLISK